MSHVNGKSPKTDRMNKDGRSPKKGGKGGKCLIDGTDHKRMGFLDTNDGPAYLNTKDPNYVPEEHATSPRKSMNPAVDEKQPDQAKSFSPRSGKADTHSAFNDRNFFSFPTPELTDADLAEDS
jgi:hypothetical protein